METLKGRKRQWQLVWMHVGSEEMQTKMGGIIEGLKQTKERKKGKKNMIMKEKVHFMFFCIDMSFFKHDPTVLLLLPPVCL